MKIAITGATGFIGANLVRYFDNGANTIYALGRSSPCLTTGNIIAITWDITETAGFDLGPIDVFIHVASNTNYRNTRENMIHSNVDSVDNVIALIQNNTKHCIYVSSSSVYQGVFGVLTEDIEIDVGNLKNNYALTKYLAEERFKEKCLKDMKLTIIRPRAVYGRGDRLLLPTILRYTFLGRLLFFGRGNTRTSLTSIGNLCEGIDLIIREQKGIEEVYNIADTQDMHTQDIYEKIYRRFGLRGTLCLPTFFLRLMLFFDKNRFSYILDNFQGDKILDISKIQQLGYIGKHTFNTFINK